MFLWDLLYIFYLWMKIPIECKFDVIYFLPSLLQACCPSCLQNKGRWVYSNKLIKCGGGGLGDQLAKYDIINSPKPQSLYLKLDSCNYVQLYTSDISGIPKLVWRPSTERTVAEKLQICEGGAKRVTIQIMSKRYRGRVPLPSKSSDLR